MFEILSLAIRTPAIKAFRSRGREKERPDLIDITCTADTLCLRAFIDIVSIASFNRESF